MEPEVSQKPIRFYEIDLLRFIAASTVILYHFTFAGYYYHGLSPVNYPILSEVFKYGFFGVELFFIISGYVVLMSAQGKTLSQFFTSRVARLYPAYWVACTICFVVVKLLAPPVVEQNQPVLDSSLGHYLVNMTMLQSFINIPNIDGVYWTLSYEIIFYFLIALMIGFGWMKHIVIVLSAWLAYCSIASIAFNTGPFATLLFPQYAPYFIAGMVLFLIQNSKRFSLKLYLILFITYILSIKSAIERIRISTEYYNHHFSNAVGLTIISLFFIVFLVIINNKFRLKQSKFLFWTGALTYPIYLCHHNIGYVVLQRFGNKINNDTLLLIMICSVLMLAYLIHKFVEQRLSKLISRNVSATLSKF